MSESMIELHHGDCFDVMATLPAGAAHLMIADLPYGVTAAEWDCQLDLVRFFDAAWRVLAPDGVMVHFAVQPFATDLINAGRRWFKYDLVWQKNKSTGHLNARRRPLRVHEGLYVFAQPRAKITYNPQFTVGHAPIHAARRKVQGTLYRNEPNIAKATTRAGTTRRYPHSVLDFAKVNNDDPHRRHPVQKPLDLLRWIVRTYSNVDDVVIDPVMGSGAAGEAALNVGRKFIGCERDDIFFNAAAEHLTGELYEPESE